MKYRALAANITKLLSANVVAAVANVAAMALVARSLGPAGLGVLALIEAYGRAVDRIVRFETWQALIRYGVAAVNDGRTDDFRRLIKVCALIDLVGGLAAALVAGLGVLVGARWFGLDGEGIAVAVAFCVSLVTGANSFAVAVLRIYDRFSVLARVTVATAFVRVALTGVAALSGSFAAFGAVLVVSNVVTNLWILRAGWRELGRRGVCGIVAAPVRGTLRDNPGLLRFVLNSNLNVLVRQSTDRFDVLVVGALVGASDAGLYQLARRIGTMAQRIDGPLRQAIYPELARLAAQGELAALRRATLAVNGAIAAVGFTALACIAPFTGEFVRVAFGEAFVPAVPLILFQFAGVTLFLNGSALGPALYAVGADAVVLRVTVIGAAVFFPVLVGLITFVGITTATLAHLVYNAVWVAACLVVFLRRTRAPAPQRSVEVPGADLGLAGTGA